MTSLTGRFATANGSKYLQQLCKHFGHRIETSCTATEGTCHFAMGPAYMTADDSGLTVRFELTGPDQAADAQRVIDRHLERFAFREGFAGMTWS